MISDEGMPMRAKRPAPPLLREEELLDALGQEHEPDEQPHDEIGRLTLHETRPRPRIHCRARSTTSPIALLTAGAGCSDAARTRAPTSMPSSRQWAGSRPSAQRVITVLQGRNHVVGFLGDGINDSPALRVADVGISVDTAVDIAKEAADIILLEKSLLVVEDGVVEGRKVFANILKYVRMGASSNFGNMFSVLGASAILPFVPMAPIQILTNNLLYDFSQVPIPTDEVDPERIARPRPWSMSDITRFILFIGPCSSILDYTTYFMMLYLFGCWDVSRASLFQTGWFVESLLTQTLIIHVIRTNKIPFLQSRASVPLMVTTGAIMVFGVWLPSSPLASALGLTHLPYLYWPLLALTLLAYMALTQCVKVLLHHRRWI
jgi:Mg2+-importing ATPase